MINFREQISTTAANSYTKVLVNSIEFLKQNTVVWVRGRGEKKVHESADSAMDGGRVLSIGEVNIIQKILSHWIEFALLRLLSSNVCISPGFVQFSKGCRINSMTFKVKKEYA